MGDDSLPTDDVAEVTVFDDAVEEVSLSAELCCGVWDSLPDGEGCEETVVGCVDLFSV